MSAADANESAGGAGMAQPGELVQGGLLCNISLFSNFFGTWALLSVLGLVSILGMSAVIFVKYYVHPTYDTWRRKSNPVYPKPHMVREEVLQMLKGLGTATLCPALTLYLSQRGVSHGYCGMGGRSLAYNAATFVATVVLSDLYEWYYHRLGHLYKPFWAHHKAHHIFFNPSPFAVSACPMHRRRALCAPTVRVTQQRFVAACVCLCVRSPAAVADDYVDQFMRSLPLVILPAVFPLNIDMMFLTYVVLFYGYGVYLHWGHEVDWPDAHHPWINTAYQHYCHHAQCVPRAPDRAAAPLAASF